MVDAYAPETALDVDHVLGGLQPEKYDVDAYDNDPIPQNFVINVDTGRHVNISRLPAFFPNAGYDHSVFPAAMVRFKDTSATLLVYGSGYIVCVGAKTPHAARLAVHRFRLMYDKLWGNIGLLKFKCDNIVMRSMVPYNVNLHEFASNEPHTTYNPKVFPGCTIKMPDIGMTGRVFDSGRYMLLGSSERRCIEQANERMQAMLRKYRNHRGTASSGKRRNFDRIQKNEEHMRAVRRQVEDADSDDEGMEIYHLGADEVAAAAERPAQGYAVGDITLAVPEQLVYAYT